MKASWCFGQHKGAARCRQRGHPAQQQTPPSLPSPGSLPSPRARPGRTRREGQGGERPRPPERGRSAELPGAALARRSPRPTAPGSGPARHLLEHVLRGPDLHGCGARPGRAPRPPPLLLPPLGSAGPALPPAARACAGRAHQSPGGAALTSQGAPRVTGPCPSGDVRGRAGPVTPGRAGPRVKGAWGTPPTGRGRAGPAGPDDVSAAAGGR